MEHPLEHETSLIGIYSWFGYKAPLSERLRAIAESGFESTCIWYSAEEEKSMGQSHANDIVKLARDLRLSVDNIHAPFRSANLIWSEEPDKNSVISDLYKNCIRFCSANDIPRVVIHISSGNNPPPLNESGLSMIHELLQLAEREGIIIAIENCRRQDYLDYIFTAMESEKLRFCYDSSHDFLYGNPPLSIIDRWGHLMTTVHLSDNNGRMDDHWLPGRGRIAWDDVCTGLKSIKYSGTVMLEVVSNEVKTEPQDTFLKEAYHEATRIRDVLAIP